MKIKEIEELQKMNLKKLYELKKEVNKEIDKLSNNTAYDIANNVEEDEATQELMDDLVALDEQQQNLSYYYENIKQVIREKEEE